MAVLLTGCGSGISQLGSPSPISSVVASGSTPPLPDQKLTPGLTNPALTKDVVCKRGFSTKPYRAVSVDEKREVYRRYGLSYPQPSGAYEVDHLIPLEIGGANDLTNLWPEPAPSFHTKDSLENVLHKDVCLGQLDLADAQKRVAANWYTLYLDVCKQGC